MEPSLGYTGALIGGHNLWPYKLVTRIFEDAQATADESGDTIEVILHTKTPVTGFARIQEANRQQQHRHPLHDATAGKTLEFSKNRTQTQQRRWELQTPRGSISCSYVVHATNGYAAHLLPFLAGQGLTEDEDDADVRHPTGTEELQHPLSQSSHPISPKPKSRGVYGIIPTRGQVRAVRASVPAEDLGWKNSWVSGGGPEYWFPRYQGLEGTTNESDVQHGIKTAENDSENGTENVTRSSNPLIILGGGRQNAGGNMESGETDDGVLNKRVSKALREFLPRWFPGKFEGGENGWEMEWVSTASFFITFYRTKTDSWALSFLDWDNGVYEDWGSFCMFLLFILSLPIFVLMDCLTHHTFTLLRSVQYYLSPTKLMRKYMKDITFQLDIRDMECLELSDGMFPFFFSSSFYVQ